MCFAILYQMRLCSYHMYNFPPKQTSHMMNVFKHWQRLGLNWQRELHLISMGTVEFSSYMEIHTEIVTSSTIQQMQGS